MNEAANENRGVQQSENNEMNILIYHTNTNSNHTAAFHFMDPEIYNNQDTDGSGKSSPAEMNAAGKIQPQIKTYNMGGAR